jgi:riboflavin synthase
MFTGIISGLGRITSIQNLGVDAAHGKQLTIETPIGYLDDVQLGDSIALNGACMTATSLNVAAHQFTIDISAQSLQKTTGWAEGSGVNLEKALRAHDRLGGHMVSGHVDGLGRVSYFSEVGESWELRIEAPPELARFIAYKGSITVNGVSLTVNRLTDDKTDDNTAAQNPPRCEFSINLIPHTLVHTTLGQLTAGRMVNLEIDLIARYCERLLSTRNQIKNNF